MILFAIISRSYNCKIVDRYDNIYFQINQLEIAMIIAELGRLVNVLTDVPDQCIYFFYACVSVCVCMRTCVV